MAAARRRPSAPITLERAFGMALRDARAAADLSQEKLGERANVHRTYVGELERGLKSPSLDVIVRLALALDVKASVLLALTEDYLS